MSLSKQNSPDIVTTTACYAPTSARQWQNVSATTTDLKGGCGLRLLVDLGVFEAEDDAPDEAAEEADNRWAISFFLGLSPLCMSCRNMYMSWHPSLCKMSISLERKMH